MRIFYEIPHCSNNLYLDPPCLNTLIRGEDGERKQKGKIEGAHNGELTWALEAEEKTGS